MNKYDMSLFVYLYNIYIFILHYTIYRQENYLHNSQKKICLIQKMIFIVLILYVMMLSI